jgi:hypothetical protein
MSDSFERLYDPAKAVDAVNNSIIVGKIVSQSPRRSGYMGDFKDIPVHVDPDCPPGKVYLLNDSFKNSALIDTRSRWQHFMDWLKGLFKRR